MPKFVSALLIFLLVIAMASSMLTETSYSKGSFTGISSEEAIQLLKSEQPEVYQTVVQHYFLKIQKQLQKQGLSRDQINSVIHQKLSNTKELFKQVKEFMIETIFKKFEMEKLTLSFQTEIRKFPDDYFLTFEMYDLLFD